MSMDPAQIGRRAKTRGWSLAQVLSGQPAKVPPPHSNVLVDLQLALLEPSTHPEFSSSCYSVGCKGPSLYFTDVWSFAVIHR